MLYSATYISMTLWFLHFFDWVVNYIKVLWWIHMSHILLLLFYFRIYDFCSLTYWLLSYSFFNLYPYFLNGICLLLSRNWGLCLPCIFNSTLWMIILIELYCRFRRSLWRHHTLQHCKRISLLCKLTLFILNLLLSFTLRLSLARINAALINNISF